MVKDNFNDKLKKLSKVFNNKDIYVIIRVEADKNNKIKKEIVRTDLADEMPDEEKEELGSSDEESFISREDFEKKNKSNYIG